MALTDNLVSYWRLDEASGNAIDTHSTHDLTDTNSVGSATGKVGNGRDFEAGSNQYFTVNDHADLSVGDIDFSVISWVNFESFGDHRGIAGHGASGDDAWYLAYIDGLGLSFAVINAAQSQTNATWGTGPSTATWYFVVAWHDATANTINIQVNNGTPVSVSHANGANNSSGPFNIGRFRGTLFQMDGIIDEVGLWKRVLTSDERTQLYNSGNGLSYDDFGGGGAENLAPPLVHGGKLLRGLVRGRLAA